LEYFQKSQKLNWRQARWSLYLSRFDFALFHQLGRLMGCLDTLSHRPDHGAGSENSDVTLLRPELFQIRVMEGIAVDGLEIPLLRNVQKVFATELELEDPVALVARELLKNRKAPSPHSAEWQISDGLLLFHGKIVVPRNKDLRCRIMEQHHNTRVVGHAGRFKTLELISQNYWWPQLSRHIGQYVGTCDACNQTTRRRCFGDSPTVSFIRPKSWTSSGTPSR
jgi:hypothetical protein